MTAEHSKAKQHVAFVSFIVSFLLAAVKLFAAVTTGSLGLLSEAIQTLFDTIATAVTWLTVRVADRPADEDHPWGHGKFESVSAFVQCGMLLGVAVWIAFEAIKRLSGGHHDVDVSPLALGVLVASILIDCWRSRALRRVAKQTGSHALEADALHFATDMLSSFVVLLGLGAIWLGYPIADSLAALVVAAFIMYAAWTLGRRTFDVLVDAAPKGVTPAVKDAAARISGVLSVDSVKVRSTGTQHSADVQVSVNRALAFDSVAAIQHAIEQAVRQAVPDISISVLASPVTPSDESIATRVRVLAAHHDLAIHNITVQHLGERVCVGLDLELDAALSLLDAHVMATRFEQYVAHDLGPHVEVETHIEPLNPENIGSREAPPTLHDMVEKDLVKAAADLGAVVRQVHNVRVRDTGEGLLVHFHARLDPQLSVRAAHEAMDAVERRLRFQHSVILRVIGHAEPMK
jgi:cation diffusion facilitator family transporter